MKRLSVAVVIVLGVVALSAAIATRMDTTQASGDRAPRATQTSSTRPAEDLPRPGVAAPALKAGVPSGHAEDSSGEPKMSYIGIVIRLPSAEEMADLGIDGGAVVVRVSEIAPAAGKLEASDVITAIDGDPVTGPQDVVEKVRAAAAEEVLTFTVIRGRDTLDVDVIVGERELKILRHRATKPGVLDGLLGRLHGLYDKLVNASVTVETADGLKTFTANAGTVSDLDVTDGTFVLNLSDGSQVPYQISEDTVVVTKHEGDLSGLNTTDRTIVVSVSVSVSDVDGEKVRLVVQANTLSGLDSRVRPLIRPHVRFPALGKGGQLSPPGLDRLPQIEERLRRLLPGTSFGELDRGDLNIREFLDRLRSDLEGRPAPIPFGGPTGEDETQPDPGPTL